MAKTNTASEHTLTRWVVGVNFIMDYENGNLVK